MISFAPNNNQASKPLFTGRTNDLQQIINSILEGDCIAIFGERRSGKTLTLAVLNDIINGTVAEYESDLIDQTLKNELPKWKIQLAGYKSIFITLHGTRSENELIGFLLDKIHENEIILSNSQGYLKLSGLLKDLQQLARTRYKKIIIMVDEMETLEYYDDNKGLAMVELFCNRIDYSSIVFIHAGSYKWKETVAIPNSQFRDLRSQYLTNIDQADMKNYLLKPIPNKLKEFVTEMSGGKPLYVQYIGEALVKGEFIVSEETLCKNVDLCEQIKQNIYEDNHLDSDSKKILSALAYHPNKNIKWFSRKLKKNTTFIKSRLDNLMKFGTIEFDESVKKYRLVGRFIEQYGKEISDDPTQLPFLQLLKKRLFPVIRLIIAGIMISFAIIIVFYVNPSRYIKEFQFFNGNIKVSLPKSLETTEKGELEMIIFNNNQEAIKNLQVILKSDDITYTNKEGKNIISFCDIGSNETDKKTIVYQGLTENCQYFNTKIFISDKFIGEFKIKCREIPLKKHWIIISSILGFTGFFIPTKGWEVLLSVIKKIVPVDKQANQLEG